MRTNRVPSVPPFRRFIPNDSAEVVESMLQEIGARDLADLFRDVPEAVRLKGELKIPKSTDEVALMREFKEVLKANKFHGNGLRVFLGGGVWLSYVPPIVDALASRAEFVTAYTPYQSEINQGLLQALFEYQSLICEVTGMDVCNASMYDGATALAEALLMACRVTKRNKVVVPANISPEKIRVVKSWLGSAGTEISMVGFDRKSGEVAVEDLKRLAKDAAAVYLEVPNFFGVIETKAEEVAAAAHGVGALFVVGVDITSLGVLKPPADYGADIVVAEGQPLGLYPNFGGPLLGVLACKGDMNLIRQMPGRLIGMTVTKTGERAFTMILQTREQHIRRERATSNICTNQALYAVRAAIYLSALGPRGLRGLAETILANGRYLAKKLSQIDGVRAPYFRSPFYRDFTIEFESIEASRALSELLKRGFVAGVELARFNEFKELSRVALSSVSEMHSKEEMDELVRAVEEVVRGGV